MEGDALILSCALVDTHRYCISGDWICLGIFKADAWIILILQDGIPRTAYKGVVVFRYQTPRRIFLVGPDSLRQLGIKDPWYRKGWYLDTIDFLFCFVLFCTSVFKKFNITDDYVYVYVVVKQ